MAKNGVFASKITIGLSSFTRSREKLTATSFMNVSPDLDKQRLPYCLLMLTE